ncbi:MAG: RHS repeat protein [Candidatus Thiodiazotropha sp. (ex Dulcina madagascariensis)]|nr:RHS repeat protein [Candidatus Thiodiazotropha sp. (ex Dulcina madagascariensis)]
MQCPLEGNPCNPATGNKTQTETDFALANGTLKVQRHYASQGVGDGFNDLGPRWRHNYSQRLDGYREPAYTQYQGKKSPLYNSPRQACTSGWYSLKSEIYGGLLANSWASYRNGACEIRQGSTYVAKLPIHNTLYGRKDVDSSIPIRTFTRANGSATNFRYLSSQWQPMHPTQAALAETATGWTFTDANGTAETYDSAGKLLATTSSTGQNTSFTYDTEGRLATITGHFGDTLTYHYDEAGILTTITTPRAT